MFLAHEIASLVVEAMGANRHMSVASARAKAAAALGAAGRLLWRRSDLTGQDDVIIDLISEALIRMGNQLRPDAKLAAAAALRGAPAHIQAECELLAALAGSCPKVEEDAGSSSPVSSCRPLQDQAILAVQHNGVLFAADDVTKYDISMLAYPVPPPPSTKEASCVPTPFTTSPSSRTNFVVVGSSGAAMADLLEAQSASIALLCARLEQRWSQDVDLAAEVQPEISDICAAEPELQCSCCIFMEASAVGTILCDGCRAGIDVQAFWLGLSPEPWLDLGEPFDYEQQKPYEKPYVDKHLGGVPLDSSECKQQ